MDAALVAGAVAADDVAAVAALIAVIARRERPWAERSEQVGPDAVDYARQNRLDLQNRLAGVTDAWRKVTVAANALRSDVDVLATANVGTDPDRRHPLNFAAEASTYTVGLRIDGPLNRQAERNAYRASLIAYQRAKREFVALADQIEFDVRNDLRQLERLGISWRDGYRAANLEPRPDVVVVGNAISRGNE